MKMLRESTVGTKLVFSFSVMFVIMTIIGLAGYKSSKQINGGLEHVFKIRMASINYLLQSDRDLQQLLVAERSMIFANSSSEIFKGLIKDHEENLQQSEERLNKFRSLASTREEKDLLARYDAARTEWLALTKKVVDGRVADTREGRREALDLTLGQANEKFEEMRDQLDGLTELTLKYAAEDYTTAGDIYHTATWTLFAVLGLGLVIGILLAWIISRGIKKSLQTVITGLSNSIHQLIASASQISAASQDLANGSSEQAAGLEETSSSLEELTSMTKQNADNSQQADTLMGEAKEIVGNANDSMADLIVAMEDIARASEKTSKIIKTIDEISFQTNLLALNAAVEAARAGEAGAGFAVVADEVRNLARRAADAAKDTSELIEGTVGKVGNGRTILNTTNESFKWVTSSATKVAQLIGEITAASKEQAQGIGQINNAISEMDQVTQRNAAGAEESSSAAAEMEQQALYLQDLVQQLTAVVSRSDGRETAVSQQASRNGKKQAAIIPGSARASRNNQKISRGSDKLLPFDDEDDCFEEYLVEEAV